MDRKGKERRPQRPCGLWVFKPCLLALACLSMVGCEHRIGLREFLATQGQVKPVPSTQPSAKKIRLDRYLGPYKVGPSDVLLITVIGGEETQETQQIRTRVYRDGTVQLPLVGSIKVADLELQDVEEAIQKAYVAEAYKEATVHIEVAEPKATSVLVTGAVATPGLVRIRRTERDLLHAIVAAGGVSSMASGQATLTRIRQPDKKETVSLVDPQGLRQALALPPLEDGDMVVVEAATPRKAPKEHQTLLG